MPECLRRRRRCVGHSNVGDLTHRDDDLTHRDNNLTHRDNDLTHRDTRVVTNGADGIAGEHKGLGKVRRGAAVAGLGLLSEVDAGPTVAANLVGQTGLLFSASLVLVSQSITVHSSATR